jgi:hypothetical protein
VSLVDEVLRYLLLSGPSRVCDIASAFKVSPRKALGAIRRLDRTGEVERCGYKEDRYVWRATHEPDRAGDPAPPGEAGDG